jgi:hypothetical protein
VEVLSGMWERWDEECYLWEGENLRWLVEFSQEFNWSKQRTIFKKNIGVIF